MKVPAIATILFVGCIAVFAIIYLPPKVIHVDSVEKRIPNIVLAETMSDEELVYQLIKFIDVMGDISISPNSRDKALMLHLRLLKKQRGFSEIKALNMLYEQLVYNNNNNAQLSDIIAFETFIRCGKRLNKK